MTPQCMSRTPPLAKPKIVTNPRTGYPDLRHDRCGQTVGVTSWRGIHGQMIVACSLPDHRADVEAQDAAYNWGAPTRDPSMEERVRHEQSESYRDAMIDSGRGALLRG